MGLGTLHTVVGEGVLAISDSLVDYLGDSSFVKVQRKDAIVKGLIRRDHTERSGGVGELSS